MVGILPPHSTSSAFKGTLFGYRETFCWLRRVCLAQICHRRFAFGVSSNLKRLTFSPLIIKSAINVGEVCHQFFGSWETTNILEYYKWGVIGIRYIMRPRERDIWTRIMYKDILLHDQWSKRSSWRLVIEGLLLNRIHFFAVATNKVRSYMARLDICTTICAEVYLRLIIPQFRRIVGGNKESLPSVSIYSLFQDDFEMLCRAIEGYTNTF